jgi:anti-sigma28 factor (negative regulator of flagellin synthesis)
MPKQTNVDLNVIAQIKEIIFNTKEAEDTKIQLVKEELLHGQYQINPSHIASKLLEFAPETQNKALEIA